MSTGHEFSPSQLFIAFENSANAIVITDSAGAIQWVNPAFSQLTGYSRTEVVGENPRIFKSGSHSPEFYAELWRTILAGRPWSGQMHNLRKDGSGYMEEMTIAAIRDQGGDISHFLAIKQDVTPRHDAGQEGEPGSDVRVREIWDWNLVTGEAFLTAGCRRLVAKLEQQLRQAQKLEAVGLLAGGVAHDFNNLLTVINGYSDMLLSIQLPGEAQEWLRMIRDAGERATDLVRRLLDYSRPQAQEVKIIDLNRLITEFSGLLQRLLPENVELTHALKPRLGAVRADPGLLQQVLMNLVVNARDAMPQGGRLEIRTADLRTNTSSSSRQPDVSHRDYVLLVMTDTGVGMDAETERRLFEPFYTTKPVGVGTGLGLSTVYRIVRQSGGWISVYSEKGVGTSVEIYLPCAEGEKAEAVVAPRVPTEGGDETILLVEDSTEVRHFISAVLRDLGYTVIAAAGGAEAVAVFEGPAAPIDLLIIDIALPDSSGCDVARQLRESMAGLAVLYISGHQLDDTVIKEMLRPGVGFLQMPFTGEALALRVRESLQSGNPPPLPLRG